MLDLAWASFITRVAILWIRLEAGRQREWDKEKDEETVIKTAIPNFALFY